MDFIYKKFEVEEKDLQKTHKLGEAKRGWKFDPKVHNVFFIGLRGSGKTSLGRLVASELSMVFVDTDEEVVKKIGKNIEDFVKDHGWDEFRAIESEILEDICSKNGQVIATGGGIILKDKNRELIKNSGFVFYLIGSIPTLMSRILNDKQNKNRPPLTHKPLEEELILSLREREPLYLSTAHFVVSAEKSLDELKQDVYFYLGVKR